MSSGARNAASLPAGTTVTPPGFRRSLAIFATTFEVATPIAALDRLCERPGGEEVGRLVGQVEVTLVDAGLLDDRGELADRGPDVS